MKKALLILFCSLLLIQAAHAALIEIGITEILDGDISSINYDNSSNVVDLLIEFYNTGSVPYKARIKAEIFNGDDMIFSGWAKENELMPGDKKISNIYWYSGDVGEYFAKLKVYFGNEVKEYKKFSFEVDESVVSEDVFDIENFRTYDDHIIFDVRSTEDVEDVIIIPSNYVSGWIFEQEKIGNMTENSSKLVVLDYYPTLWISSSIDLLVVSDNGRYYTEKTIELKKNEGLTWLFYYLIDSLRIAFS